MARYYLDACIWRDYFENRSDRFRPLGDWALALINNILERKDVIVISGLLMRELGKIYCSSAIQNILGIASEQGLLIQVNHSPEQLHEAIGLSRERRMDFEDVLHSIIARDTDSILVTRDKHFEKLRDLVDIRKPEELL